MTIFSELWSSFSLKRFCSLNLISFYFWNSEYFSLSLPLKLIFFFTINFWWEIWWISIWHFPHLLFWFLGSFSSTFISHFEVDFIFFFLAELVVITWKFSTLQILFFLLLSLLPCLFIFNNRIFFARFNFSFSFIWSFSSWNQNLIIGSSDGSSFSSWAFS